jgi:hypothetical protein
VTRSENLTYRLDEIDRPQFTDKPPEPVKFGTQQKPNPRFQLPPAPAGEFVPSLENQQQQVRSGERSTRSEKLAALGFDLASFERSSLIMTFENPAAIAGVELC